MKGKMVFKKSLAVVMSAACMAGLLPAGVFAQEVADEVVVEASEDDVYIQDVFEEVSSDYAVENDCEYIDDEGYVPETVDSYDLVMSDNGKSKTLPFTLKETYTLKDKGKIEVDDTLEISESDDSFRVYEIKVPAAGRISFQAASDGIDWWLSCKPVAFYDLDPFGKSDQMWQLSYGNMNAKDEGEFSETFDLIEGSYYLYLSRSTAGEDVPEYNFVMSYNKIDFNAKTEETVFDTCAFGSNKDEDSSVDIELDKKTYVAQSSYSDADNYDWFKFTLNSTSSLYLTASTDDIDNLGFSLYQYSSSGAAQMISLYEQPVTIGKAVFNNKGVEINSIENYELIKSSDGIMADAQNKTPHSTFEDGVYYLQVHKQYGVKKQESKTGAYRFKVLTKIKTASPVTEIQILDGTSVAATSKKATPGTINIAINQEKKIGVNVLPANADVQTYSLEIDNPKIATIEETEGTMILKPVAAGECNLTVTTDGVDKNGETLTTSCAIVVREEATEKACPTVITKQKVDLTGEEYFGSAIDKKNEKLMVVDPDTADNLKPTTSKLGSVSKVGLFTAKKPGKVTVLRMLKNGKVYEETARITFDIETPVINYPILDNGKQAKNFTLVKAGVVYKTADFISTTSEQKPTFTSSDKKNKISELSSLGGMFVMMKSGTVKLTASYGEGKNAAKYTIVIKASYPKTNPAKITLKEGQTKVVKVTNVQPGLIPSWAVAEKDDTGKLVPTEIIEAEYVDESHMSVCVTGIESGDALLAVIVDGANYFCEVHVK